MQQSKRQKLDQNQAAQVRPKRYRCEPCNKSFTERRTLLRHQRESTQHRPRTGQDAGEYSCSNCEETFVRLHDRDRHYREQHANGKVICSGCGKRLRRNVPHQGLTGMPCEGESSGQLSSTDSTITTTFSSHSSAQNNSRERSPEEVCDGKCFLSMGKKFSQMSLEQMPICNKIYDKQVRAARSKRPLPCGICRAAFEIENKGALFDHLNRHFNQLIKAEHACEVCQIAFIHAEDLKKHLESAANGDCGFNFDHRQPCKGHHPPPCEQSDLAKLLWSDDDRFNFTFRVWQWEQRQLQAYTQSVSALQANDMEGTVVSGPSCSRCPSCEFITISKFGISSRTEYGLPEWLPESYRTICPCGSSSLHDKFDSGSTLIKTLVSKRAFYITDTEGGKYFRARSRSFTEGSQDYVSSRRAAYFANIPYLGWQRWEDELKESYRKTEWNYVLHHGAAAGKVELVSAAIEQGVNLDQLDHNGCSALHLAVISGSLEVLQMLLQHGARPDRSPGIITQRATPVSLCLEQSFYIMLEELLRHGARVVSPYIYLASQKKQTGCLRVLLDHIASKLPDDPGLVESPFPVSDQADTSELCCYQNPEDDPRFPALATVDPAHWQYILGCALYYACSAGGIEVVRLLIAHGAKIKDPSTITSRFVDAAAAGDIEIMEYLLMNGASLDQKLHVDSFSLFPLLPYALHLEVGRIAMHKAAQNCRPNVIEFLLRKGVKPDEDTCAGHTLLCTVIKQRDLPSTQLLVENGANLNFRCPVCNCSPLDSAVISCCSIVEYLIAQGVDLNAELPNGCTALCTALIYEKDGVLQAMRDAGGHRGRCRAQWHAELAAK